MAGSEFLLPSLITAATAATSVGLSSMNRPKASRPTPMPDPQSPEVMEARRRRIEERRAAGGRESTILSDDSYGNSLLGE